MTKRLVQVKPFLYEWQEEGAEPEEIELPEPQVFLVPQRLTPKLNNNHFEHTLDWADLKEAYLNAVAGREICQRSSNQAHIQSFNTRWKHKTEFFGPNSTEVSEWLRKGYKQPGLTLDPPIEPIRKRRRLKFGDEGELQLDLMWSGHDYPFLQWSQRDIMPGMKIEILYNFVSSTDVGIIIEYCRFILRSLIALESAGIDLEISVYSDSSGVFSNGSEMLYNRIRVKKEGEQSDYLSWSAMVSPGGFRHLMFLDLVIASDHLKRDASRGLGRGTNMGQRWQVNYEPSERVLRFLCPWAPHSFPESEMEMELREVLQNARRAA